MNPASPSASDCVVTAFPLSSGQLMSLLEVHISVEVLAQLSGGYSAEAQRLAEEGARHSVVKDAAGHAYYQTRDEQEGLEELMLHQRRLLEECLDVVAPGWAQTWRAQTDRERVPVGALEQVAQLVLEVAEGSLGSLPELVALDRAWAALERFRELRRGYRQAEVRMAALRRVVLGRRNLLQGIIERLEALAGEVTGEAARLAKAA